jgi:hypothetical protein
MEITIDDSYKISADRERGKIYSAQAGDIVYFRGDRFVVLDAEEALACSDCDLNIDGCTLRDYAVLCGMYKRMSRVSTAMEEL